LRSEAAVRRMRCDRKNDETPEPNESRDLWLHLPVLAIT
jgi:hypothetical protein